MTIKTKLIFSFFVLLGGMSLLRAGEIPFEMVKGLMIIEVNVNGSNGKYIFDTGADHCILDSGQLAKGEITIYTGSGEKKGGSAHINHLSIGHVNKENLDAAIMDLTNLDDFLGFDVKGIMPGKIFDPHYVQLDYANRLIVVTEKISKEIKNQFKYKWNIESYDRVALTKIKMGSEDAYFILDSGASTTYFSSEAIQQWGGLATGTVNQTVTAQGMATNQEYMIPEISVDGFTVQNLKVFELDLDQLSKAMGKKLCGIINLRLLSHSQILFDFKKNVIYF